MMWKSTILNGSEYLVIMRGLGFKSYVILIVYCFDNMIGHDEW